MASGTLAAFAVSTLGGVADHTYVVSGDGHRWRCGGRSRGGQSICEGTGNVDEANCLSQKNSNAGIKYLRTGDMPSDGKQNPFTGPTDGCLRTWLSKVLPLLWCLWEGPENAPKVSSNLEPVARTGSLPY